MECMRASSALGIIPDFSLLDNVDLCTSKSGHNNPTTAQAGTLSGNMISTSSLSQSARAGCPWRGILWEATKQTCQITDPQDQDFVYWRYDGESFFEPWCWVESSDPERNMKIEIYTTVEPDNICWISEFPRKDVVEGSATWEKIRQWRKECSTHAECSQTGLKDQTLPDRIIDVGSTLESPYVRLVETKGLSNNSAAYVCLSHCWGKPPMPIKTTNETIEQHKNRIGVELLPHTFRDAVIATRQLGCQYLWIDSLCIIQENDTDWMEQAPQMARIYQNSILTLAAAASNGPNDGLFRAPVHPISGGHPLDLSPFNVPFPIHTRAHIRYNAGHLAGKQSHTLLDRGWVLQERLLSPRVVYFGHNEIAWECMESKACECEPQLQPYPTTKPSPRDPINPKAAFSQSLTRIRLDESASVESNDLRADFWHGIVNAYTGLKLTFPKDKFPALGGLASAIEGVRSGDIYYAGLWKSTLEIDLLWRRQRMGDYHASSFGEHYDRQNVFASDTDKNEFERKFNHRLWGSWKLERLFPEYRAPTWSWGSVLTQVEYDREVTQINSDLVDIQFVTVKTVSCMPEGGDTKGRLLPSTSIQLIGKVVEVELRLIQQNFYNTGLKVTEPRLTKDGRRIPFSDPDYELATGAQKGLRVPLEDGMRLFCLQIATGKIRAAEHMRKTYSLVLRERGEGKEGFERVGMLQLVIDGSREKDIFDNVSDETEVLIF